MAHEFIVKPPYDAFTPVLKVSNGCAHDKCRFCSIYHGISFSMNSMDQIIEGIEQVERSCNPVEKRRIYFAGGNPFTLPNAKLFAIMDEVEARIPEVKSYGGLACVRDIKRRSDDELRALAERGVNMLCIGAESGYDPALEFMQKGHTGQDLVEQGQRLHAAGIDFSFFYLAGMAGGGQCEQNAIASGKAFSLAGPKQVIVMTLSPTKTWPLHDDIKAGRWLVPREDEMSWEIRTFIENLDCNTYVDCSHDSDTIKFTAMLPKDKENALMLLDNYIPKMNVRSARRIRELLFKATYE